MPPGWWPGSTGCNSGGAGDGGARVTQSNSTRRSRFTIERLRTLVLVGAAVLVVAIGAFLYTGNRLRRFLKTDLPKRLGVDIESQADGVNYTQSRKGKTLFQLHASRAVRMKEGGKSMLHDVTLGGSGKETGDRHPKISCGVMIGAGAKILGNIEVGENARIAAGSVVLSSVPANTTVAGVPARVVRTETPDQPSRTMDQILSDLAFQAFDPGI